MVRRTHGADDSTKMGVSTCRVKRMRESFVAMEMAKVERAASLTMQRADMLFIVVYWY